MIEFILEPLQYSFMVRGMIAAVLVGIVCAVVGTYVVLRGMAFFGDALAHSILPGVAIGYLVGGGARLLNRITDKELDRVNHQSTAPFICACVRDQFNIDYNHTLSRRINRAKSINYILILSESIDGIVHERSNLWNLLLAINDLLSILHGRPLQSSTTNHNLSCFLARSIWEFAWATFAS